MARSSRNSNQGPGVHSDELAVLIENMKQIFLGAYKSGEQFDKAVDATSLSIERFDKALTGATNSSRGAILSPLTRNVGEVRQELSDLSQRQFGGSLQQGADAVFGGAGGSFIGDVRDTLGGLQAQGSATDKLSGLADKFSRMGMPMDESERRILGKMFLNQETAAEKARRSAEDTMIDLDPRTDETSHMFDWIFDQKRESRAIEDKLKADRARRH